MAIFLALGYEDLASQSFGSHTGADTEEKDLREILESYLSGTGPRSFWFENDTFPPVRERSGSQFDTRSQFALMEGCGRTAVCPWYISSGTWQSSDLLQKLEYNELRTLIPVLPHLKTLAGWFVNAQLLMIFTASDWTSVSRELPLPPHTFSHPLPWWSQGFEAHMWKKFFLVGCLSHPVSYKLLYWRCRDRNPYLLYVAWAFSSLNLRTIICSNSPNSSQCDLTCWVVFRSFVCTISWFGRCVTALCVGSSGMCKVEHVRVKWGERHRNIITMVGGLIF